LSPAFTVIAVGGDPNRKATDIEASHFPGLADQQSRIVAGIDVDQLVCPRIQFTVEERDIPIGGRIVVDVEIDLAHNLVRG